MDTPELSHSGVNAPGDAVPAPGMFGRRRSDEDPSAHARDPRNAADGKGEARRDEDKPVKPDFYLVGTGLFVIFASLLFSDQIETTQQTFVMMLGTTITLFGVYPLPTQSGTVGWLKIVGPGALFIFLAGLAVAEIRQERHSAELARAAAAQNEARLLVLQVSQSPGLNQQVLPDSSMVRVLNVDSFDDEALVGVLAQMRSTLEQALGNTVPARVDTIQRITFKRMIRTLNFPDPDSAEALYDSALRDPRGVDAAWAQLVKWQGELLGDDEFEERVKALPFAFIAIEKNNAVHVEPVVPGHLIAVGGGVYAVPVIANPKLTVIGNSLEEAIVLQRTSPPRALLAAGDAEGQNVVERLFAATRGERNAKPEKRPAVASR
jgi:hypothetical protein